MKEYIVQPQSGTRIEVKKGPHITIIDVEGGQVADFFAEIEGTHEEYLSSSVTLDCNESINIKVSAILYSNLYRPMFEIIYDDVEKYDLLFPSCSKAMFDFFYQNGTEHPNCLDNINTVLGTKRSIIQPINFFMNTHIQPNGKIDIRKPISKARDKVVLSAFEDCVLGISACSVAECDTNSGRCTATKVLVF